MRDFFLPLRPVKMEKIKEESLFFLSFFLSLFLFVFFFLASEKCTTHLRSKMASVSRSRTVCLGLLSDRGKAHRHRPSEAAPPIILPPPRALYPIFFSLVMANNPTDGAGDDFLEQILGMQTYAGADSNLAGTAADGASPMVLQLNSGDGSSHLAGAFQSPVFPLGLSLEQGGNGGFLNPDDASGSGKRFRDDVFDSRPASTKNVFHGQPIPNTVPAMPHPPAVRPRVRARRGQATDPHSIAERLRRERIAERIRALQDLVPSVNKTDRAAMLDEIVDYVKFLRLQVKVLSMSRLGGAGAVAPLVTDIPISSVEEEGGEGGMSQPAWEKWSNDGTERQVAKLMEENVGAAMQLLQSKALCIMPISLASAIYPTQPPDTTTTLIKPESNPPP